MVKIRDLEVSPVAPMETDQAEERSIDLDWRLLLNYYGLPRRGK